MNKLPNKAKGIPDLTSNLHLQQMKKSPQRSPALNYSGWMKSLGSVLLAALHTSRVPLGALVPWTHQREPGLCLPVDLASHSERRPSPMQLILSYTVNPIWVAWYWNCSCMTLGWQYPAVEVWDTKPQSFCLLHFQKKGPKTKCTVKKKCQWKVLACVLGQLARDTGLSACLLQKVAFTQHLLYRVLHFLKRAMIMELFPFYKLKKKNKAQKNVTHMKKEYQKVISRAQICTSDLT